MTTGPRRIAACVIALVLPACGGGGGEDTSAPPTSATPAAAGGGCGERLTFSETAWEAAPSPSATAPPGTVQWQARFTFGNPNAFDVRLADGVVVLEIDTSDGHRSGTGRTAFVDPAEATMAPRSSLERVASAWMRNGKIPKTTQVYVTTAATIGGSTCAVPVDRVSTTAPSPQVFTLPDCGSESC